MTSVHLNNAFGVIADNAREMRARYVVPNDVNAVLTVVATPDLDDWVVAPGKTWPREYNVDLTQGLCLPDLGTQPPPKMFFRWRLTIGDAD